MCRVKRDVSRHHLSAFVSARLDDMKDKSAELNLVFEKHAFYRTLPEPTRGFIFSVTRIAMGFARDSVSSWTGETRLWRGVDFRVEIDPAGRGDPATSVSALVARFLTELAAVETDAERLKREERALRARIGSFRAADRLAREDVHRRDL